MKKWNSFCTAFLVLGALFFLWQGAAWQGVANTRALAALAGTGQVIYYLAGLVGLFLGGVLVDKTPIARMWRPLVAVLAAVAAVCTVAARFSPSLPVLAVLLVVGGLCGFAALAPLLYRVFRQLPFALKPVVMGLAMGLGLLLLLPADYQLAFGWDADWFYTLLAAVAMLVLAVLVLLWKPRARQVGIEFPPADKKHWPGLLLLGGICSVLLLLLPIALESSFAEVYFTNAQKFALCVAQALSPLLAGLLAIRFGRNTTMFLGVAVMGVGLVSYFFPHSGGWGLGFSMAGAVGHALFLVPLVVMFTDVAQYARGPGVVGVLGFAFAELIQLLGLPISSLLRFLGEDIGLIIYLVVYFVALPLATIFFVQLQRFKEEHEEGGVDEAGLRAPPKPTETTADLRPYAFTPHEEAVLPYAIGPMATVEIAVVLRLSPDAASALVHSILGKTQTPSRRALRLLLVGDGADMPDEDEAPEENA